MERMNTSGYWPLIEQMTNDGFVNIQDIETFFVENKSFAEFQDFVTDSYCLFMKQQLMEKEIDLNVQKAKINDEILEVNTEIDELELMIQAVTEVRDTLTKKRARVLKECEQYNDSIRECSSYRKRIKDIEESQLFKRIFNSVEK